MTNQTTEQSSREAFEQYKSDNNYYGDVWQTNGIRHQMFEIGYRSALDSLPKINKEELQIYKDSIDYIDHIFKKNKARHWVVKILREQIENRMSNKDA